jgi:hypothetical protein
MTQCRAVPVNTAASGTCQPALYGGAADQTCAQEYAGELLAYFMKVVLGKAGRPELREEWRRRALDQPLDLESIHAILNGGGHAKSELMVLDSNLQGFSEVLYHYDPQLNQFKGRFVYHSIYPSAELIALRILLLKKIHRREKIDLTAVLKHRDMLLESGHQPDALILDEMNLEVDEFRLLSQVFRADPQLIAYLGNPFLVKALKDVEAIREDRQVSELARRANYRGIYPGSVGRATQEQAVTIAILPSMTKEFVSGSISGSGTERFLPTENYRSAAADIIRGLEERIRLRFQEAASTRARDSWPTDRIETALRFFNADKRPLLVHPQNAERVLADICPHADYAIILLGENVYRAVDFDATRDAYPFTNRFYIDIAEVRHGQIESELDLIGEAVFTTLAERFARDVRAVATQLQGSAAGPNPTAGRPRLK